GDWSVTGVQTCALPIYDVHAVRGELEVATLRLDGQLAAYVVALTDGPTYRVFDGRFAPAWRRYSPGRRLEAAVVDHACRGPYRAVRRAAWRGRGRRCGE